MARFHEEMLAASRQLLAREPNRRGKLASARVRRSISTSYYALFHYLLDECANRVVGTRNDLRRRRRIFVRTITHRGLRLALGKVKGIRMDEGVRDFFNVAPDLGPPASVREMANLFLTVQDQRHEADYDLNAALSEVDAHWLIDRVENAIAAWEEADTPAHRDFKHALCLLIVLKGKLRGDEG